jgi:hypothetical protein
VEFLEVVGFHEISQQHGKLISVGLLDVLR